MGGLKHRIAPWALAVRFSNRGTPPEAPAHWLRPYEPCFVCASLGEIEWMGVTAKDESLENEPS
jgi:hypothetical protein